MPDVLDSDTPMYNTGLKSKEERAAKMGMNAITSDMAKQRWALQSSFLEAESATASRLTEVEAVRMAVETTCQTKLSGPSPTGASAEVSRSMIRSRAAVRAGVHVNIGTRRTLSKFLAVLQGQPSGGVTSTAQTKEFMELLASIAEVKSQIEGLDRPQGLPPPGQLLPPLEVTQVLAFHGDSAVGFLSALVASMLASNCSVRL